MTRQEWVTLRRSQETIGLKFQPEGVYRRSRWPLFQHLLKGFWLALKIVGMQKRAMANAARITVNPIEIAMPRLPLPFDGYRILHVSDPHFAAFEPIAEGVRRIAEEHPVDLAVFTGDYRADFVADPELAVKPLAPILKTIDAKDGILFTLGNHDSIEMVEPIEDFGGRVLGNESIEVTRRDQAITITGIDDVHMFYSPAVEEALRTSPNNPVRILLAHSAEFYDAASDSGYDLYLCGHTHGGQICLPGGVPLITHSMAPRRFASGMWHYRSMVGYTNRGAGVSGIPARFNCPAEVALFTLRCQDRRPTPTQQR